ncbi:uncharacterized protein At4g15970-like isoform X3 [Typha angustifolia]|uniref:uncharacterized protein At4g15970-like isoform X3 n=1 Tax=Typha angustifolia TaxID=59011 RepID=UPI003C2B0BFE
MGHIGGNLKGLERPLNQKVMSNMNNLPTLVSFLLGAAAATALILFLRPANPAGGRSQEISSWGIGIHKSSNESLVNSTKMAPYKETKPAYNNDEQKDLRELLRAAAMDNDTVILTWINEAWAAPNSLLDLFFESFHVGEQIEHLLKHLIIVSVDPKAFERCKSLHPHCYYINMGGNDFTSEKFFMTDDYVDMMWKRNRFQQKVLELGYNFLFTDVDILWFRNPFRHISAFAHMTFSSDAYYGNPDDLKNFPNGGFLYVKSCSKTIEFYKDWYIARKDWVGAHEQWVFNEIKVEYSAKHQVKIQFVDTAIWGGFCNLSKDMNRIVIMHANCCVGLGIKLFDLRNLLDDWKNYTRLSAEDKAKGQLSWRLPGRCVHEKKD